MNFEVFSTEAESNKRAGQLRSQGATVIQDFNGSVYTIKWRN